MRRPLGNLLLMTGLILMAWPVIAWAYGLYWQQHLARGFDARVPEPALQARIGNPAVAAALTARAVGHRLRKRHTATATPPRLYRTSTPPAPAPDALGDDPEAESAYSGPISWLRHAAAEWTHGTAVARLRIDRIGLNAVVVEGAGRVALRQGPGHVPGTGLPGDWTNCAIAAHRDAWFRRLHEVRTGDPVWIETRDGIYEYAVTHRMVVTPNRADLLDQGFQPVLTLITCTGPGYPHSRYRLLVFCRLRASFPR